MVKVLQIKGRVDENLGTLEARFSVERKEKSQ